MDGPIASLLRCRRNAYADLRPSYQVSAIDWRREKNPAAGKQRCGEGNARPPHEIRHSKGRRSQRSKTREKGVVAREIGKTRSDEQRVDGKGDLSSPGGPLERTHRTLRNATLPHPLPSPLPTERTGPRKLTSPRPPQRTVTKGTEAIVTSRASSAVLSGTGKYPRMRRVVHLPFCRMTSAPHSRRTRKTADDVILDYQKISCDRETEELSARVTSCPPSSTRCSGSTPGPSRRQTPRL